MSTESTVEEVIRSFISDETLFTALDVSNKVKEIIPSARHREVRDFVREAWLNTIEVSGYGRTPITVTLTNGSVAQALLYHPLADSWDLDAKYDNQKRAQEAKVPVSDSVSTPVVIGDSSVSVSDDGAVVITPTVSDNVAKVKSVSKPVSKVVDTPVRDQWKQIFATQPSMFPRQ